MEFIYAPLAHAVVPLPTQGGARARHDAFAAEVAEHRHALRRRRRRRRLG